MTLAALPHHERFVERSEAVVVERLAGLVDGDLREDVWDRIPARDPPDGTRGRRGPRG